MDQQLLAPGVILYFTPFKHEEVYVWTDLYMDHFSEEHSATTFTKWFYQISKHRTALNSFCSQLKSSQRIERESIAKRLKIVKLW